VAEILHRVQLHCFFGFFCQLDDPSSLPTIIKGVKGVTALRFAPQLLASGLACKIQNPKHDKIFIGKEKTIFSDSKF